MNFKHIPAHMDELLMKHATYYPLTGKLEVKGWCETLNGNGYIRFTKRINGTTYDILAHRLAMRMLIGTWHFGIIDHINRDKLDNRAKNIRVVSSSTNNHNRNKGTGNYTSQYVGVSWSKTAKKFQATICIDLKRNHLGYFSTEFAAHKAYVTAKALVSH
jgi:hypothetical protein